MDLGATEFGAVRLFGLDLNARAEALINIAAPDFRVDLRAAWWGVGDQLSTGSCVGWGSTDGVARYQFVKAGRLAQNAKLSPRYTWMASKPCFDRGSPVTASVVQCKHGSSGIGSGISSPGRNCLLCLFR